MERKIKERFEELYNEYKDYKILIVSHRRADPDAVASAIALSSLFPNSNIAFPDLLPNSKAILEELNIEYFIIKNLNLERFEKIIAVDTCSAKMAEGVPSVIACIDHHHKDKNSFKPKYDIASTDYSSASELIYELIKEKIEIENDVAFALAIGIAADTYRFKAANLKTMKIFTELLEKSGRDMEDVYKFSDIKYKSEEKIYLLDALKNIEYVYINGIVVAFTETKRYASEIASLLASVADITIVMESFKNGYKMSAREGDYNLELNVLMSKLGDAMNGYGGGHQKAAGAYAEGTKKEIIDTIIYIVQEMQRDIKN